MLNNSKDDLGKFDPKSDESVFVRYSCSSKVYVFNKRTLCFEESVYVIFDESGNLNNIDMKDDDDLLQLFKLQNNATSRTEEEVNLDSDVADLTQSKKVIEDYQPAMESGLSNGASQVETHPPVNVDSKDE